ncbi:uncharacterized protein NH340_JMT01327 [Sarcoptes scabiei]|nr:uncharacterized protein NH340_JMT01327 [Sarcoptes scabiei]
MESHIYSNKIFKQTFDDLRFIEIENMFVYNVIKKDYSKFFNDFRPKDFQLIANLDACLDDNSKKMFSDTKFFDKISRFDLPDILYHLIYLFNMMPACITDREWKQKYLSDSFKSIMKRLDMRSSHLLKQDWPKHRHEFFLISHLWFMTGLSKYIEFNHQLIRIILNEKSIDKESLLNLMFNLCIIRQIKSSEKTEIIAKTSSLLYSETSLDIEELAVIGLGFFKTQTRMSYPLAKQYINLCAKEFLKSYEIKTTISIVAILKSIRYSIDKTDSKPTDIKILLNRLLESFNHHRDQIYQSAICLSHLILLMNSSSMFDRNIYRQLFNQFMLNLQSFRIKDIDRILFSLANIRFKYPSAEIRKLEQHLMNLDQTRLYPYHIYSIVLYLLLMDYYPKDLIRICCDREFFAKTIKMVGNSRSTQMLIIDTVFRLKFKNHPVFLTDLQRKNFLSSLKVLLHNENSLKGQFLKTIQSVLSSHFKSSFKMIYLLPFVTYPFPVILNESIHEKICANLQLKIAKNHSESLSYNHNFLQSDYFQDCLVILPVFPKDYIEGSQLRGFIYLQKELLENLGFKRL